MTEILTEILWFAGAGLCLLAAVGVWRMPDLYTRMQASTKAQTLGLACLLAGTALQFPDVASIVKAISVGAFVMMSRARSPVFTDGGSAVGPWSPEPTVCSNASLPVLRDGVRPPVGGIDGLRVTGSGCPVSASTNAPTSGNRSSCFFAIARSTAATTAGGVPAGSGAGWSFSTSSRRWTPRCRW